MFLEKAKQQEMLIATTEGPSPGNAGRCVTVSKHLCTLSCHHCKACLGNLFGEDSTNSSL